jgi:hypothetical protein
MSLPLPITVPLMIEPGARVSVLVPPKNWIAAPPGLLIVPELVTLLPPLFTNEENPPFTVP